MNETNGIGCGCAACQNGEVVDPVYNQNQQNSYNSLDAPGPDANPNTFANYLTNGFWEDTGRSSRSWTQDEITFSTNGFTASQTNGIREAFDLWADVADISFTEVSSNADITVNVGTDGRAYSSSFTSSTPNGQSNSTITSNTISMDTSRSSWRDIDDNGDYAFMSIIHEIGHSLGLGHTGNYNGSASYSNNAQWANDSHQMTVMSYFNDTNVGSDHFDSTNLWQYSATPMLIDILAIQNIYGADFTTRSGDSTYGFNSNTGRDSYDFNISEAPIAIWDGAGNDTIDLSGYSTTQTLYLTEGYFSSVGHMTNNLIIAYGAEIENAIGGSGSDTIYANDLSNNINCGLGNDFVTYAHNITDFAFNFISNTVVALTHIVDNFTDTISNIENFIFADSSYSFTELEENYGDLETVGIRMYWENGGLYKYNSKEADDFTVDAIDMNYNSSNGDQISISRNFYDTTVTILDANTADRILLNGSSSDDTLTIDGTHNNLSSEIYGGDGNDEIYVDVNGRSVIYGDAGHDTIWALSIGNDYLYGGMGMDNIYGGEGQDNIYGDDGDDTLAGGNERDWLYGGSGDDVIHGDDGSDIIRGGTGIDGISGGDGYDRIFGDEGNDLIHGDAGNDRISGGADNDTISGGLGQDFIYGDEGNDLIEGGESADYLYGGDGADEILGDNGNDRIYGGNDEDLINGGDGADFLYGEGANDRIYGGNGSDRIIGGIGNDFIAGQNNNDTIYGGIGMDSIYGGSHDDFINGGDGQDFLYGGDGNDIIYGEADADILVGGSGADALYLGNGSNFNTAYFKDSEDSIDRIYNFDYGNDFINITELLTGFDANTSDINEFVDIVHTGSRFDVYVDRDGGGDEFESVARIYTNINDSLTAQDFLDSTTLIVDQTLTFEYS